MELPSSLQTLLGRDGRERRMGPFVLVEQLGRGGFAPVWLARETYGTTELRAAAVKLFALDRGEGSPDASLRSRILEEARALCRVEHPNVVRFYALPVDEKAGVVGVAMEYVAGTSIDRRLGARGRLSLDESLAIGVAVASALGAVHRAGLVHRDVKPANIVEAGGVYKLIDFGIAAADEVRPARLRPAERPRWPDLPIGVAGSRPSEIDRSRLSNGGDTDETAPLAVRAGTVGYIDPDCIARGAPATASSDLYGLGVTLFQCLTGLLPSAREGETRLRGDVLDGRAPAPSLSVVEPDAPAALARLVDSLLARDPQERPRSAESVAIQLEQIRSGLADAKRAPPPESVGPFRGLGRFEESDRDVYFGRTSEVASALEMLRGRGLVALVGPSGSGKSSLARAGLVPALASGALGVWPKRWDRVVVSPGEEPRETIRAALRPFVGDVADREPSEIVAALAARTEMTGWGFLLVVDQLEELATVTLGESARWAARLLGAFGRDALPGVRAVVAARRDLLDGLLALEGLGEPLVRGLVLVEPVREYAWGEILDRALGLYGYTFEDAEMRDEILAELRQTASAMPLVQFALTELWDARDVAKKRLTRKSLVALGGISGALERHAEATLAELGRGRGTSATRDEARMAEAVRRVLLSLTTAQGTRRTRSASDIERIAGSLGTRIATLFERSRLIVKDSDGLGLAHEAVLTQWTRLRVWVAEARADRTIVEELERDAATWLEDRSSASLWRGRRLATAEEVVRRDTVEIGEAASAFLRASRSSARRARLGIAAAGAALVLSLSTTAIVYLKAERDARADQEQRFRAEHDKQAAIEEKQAQIDALLKGIEDSDTKRKAVALQNEIHDAQGLPPVVPVAASTVAVGPAAPPRVVAAPAPTPVTPATAPTSTSIKVQRSWP